TSNISTSCCGLASATTVPRRGVISTMPAEASWKRASRSGVRETSNRSASAVSSSRIPGGYRPVTIPSSILSRTRPARVLAFRFIWYKPRCPHTSATLCKPRSGLRCVNHCGSLSTVPTAVYSGPSRSPLEEVENTHRLPRCRAPSGSFERGGGKLGAVDAERSRWARPVGGQLAPQYRHRGSGPGGHVGGHGEPALDIEEERAGTGGERSVDADALGHSGPGDLPGEVEDAGEVRALRGRAGHPHQGAGLGEAH